MYHGWKLDVTGHCVDTPNEPAETNFKDKVRAEQRIREGARHIMVKVSNVSHIIYPVTDLEKSIDFLTNALGFYRQRRGQTTYLGIGDTLLELVQGQGTTAGYVEAVRRIAEPEGAERPTLYLLGLAVDDLDEALRVVQEHGGEVVRPIWNARTFWGRQAVIKDPGGQQIALREWRPPDGPHFQGWQPEATSDSP